MQGAAASWPAVSSTRRPNSSLSVWSNGNTKFHQRTTPEKCSTRGKKTHKCRVQLWCLVQKAKLHKQPFSAASLTGGTFFQTELWHRPLHHLVQSAVRRAAWVYGEQITHETYVSGHEAHQWWGTFYQILFNLPEKVWNWGRTFVL